MKAAQGQHMKQNNGKTKMPLKLDTLVERGIINKELGTAELRINPCKRVIFIGK